ncbi:replication factor C large subunit [Candidatus Woesearchaeota archaeon]|nr:MAG: replication factor C large subunit [Candidatus Woesearchaeota archaeon]
MDLFIQKYKPKSLKDIEGQPTAELQNYVQTYAKQKKKALLVYGPIGTGKTASVHAMAADLSLELIEINASDVRNKDAILSTIGNAIKQQSLFQKGKIILIDEVDGIAGNADRGGLQTILTVIENSTFPVILTANDVWDQKFSSLRKSCHLVEFQTLNYLSILASLKKICHQEHISFDELALQQLCRESDGDMRAAINDLQVLASDKNISQEEVTKHFQRRTKQSISQALLKVFKTKQLDVALPAFEDVNEDLDKIFLWMDENIPLEYQKTEDLARALDYLSLADVYFGRIRRWQHYRFYVYIYNFLSAGVALSKDEKYPGLITYKPTSRILKLWMANQKNLKKKAIAGKVAEKTHSSIKRSLEDVSYLRYLFQHKKNDAIIQFLDLNSEEVLWLSK